MTAGEQLRRLLHAVPRLADGTEHPYAEVAEAAGVDVRVLVRDLDELASRDHVPGGFVEGVQIYLTERGVSFVTAQFLRPMRLTMPELCALELGLAVLRRERAHDELPALDRALVTLRRAIAKTDETAGWEGVRHAELTAAGDPGHRAVLREAVRTRTRVRLRYRGSTDTEPGERVVEPYALVWSERAWYAVAHCTRADGIRLFRLDRVEAAEPTSECFTVPEGFSVDAVLADGRPFRTETPPATARVWYSPRVARWVAEREGATLADDGSLVLEHPVADPAWLARHVLQYGPDAEVLEPAELRAYVAERLRAIVEGTR